MSLAPADHAFGLETRNFSEEIDLLWRIYHYGNRSVEKQKPA
jgi:hypothetical protein